MLSVVVVDDSVVVRERLVELLNGLSGVEVVGLAGGVDEARRVLRETRPRVVLVDIRIPGGSGFDVLQEAKALHPAPLVIILTSFPYPQFRKKCLEMGADHFLDKSLEFERVPEIVTAMVEQERAEA